MVRGRVLSLASNLGGVVWFILLMRLGEGDPRSLTVGGGELKRSESLPKSAMSNSRLADLQMDREHPRLTETLLLLDVTSNFYKSQETAPNPRQRVCKAQCKKPAKSSLWFLSASFAASCTVSICQFQCAQMTLVPST